MDRIQVMEVSSNPTRGYDLPSYDDINAKQYIDEYLESVRIDGPIPDVNHPQNSVIYPKLRRATIFEYTPYSLHLLSYRLLTSKRQWHSAWDKYRSSTNLLLAVDSHSSFGQKIKSIVHGLWFSIATIRVLLAIHGIVKWRKNEVLTELMSK